MKIEEYYSKTFGFSPNPLQTAVWEAYRQDSHPALLVRAGTGTGKTEAILAPALADNRRVVMVLPSKALIEDMGQRVRRIGGMLSSHNSGEVTVTVDMGGNCRRYVCQQGDVEERTYHRHLFADDIIVTTLDKFLFRLFGYGEEIKSYIFPHRIFGSAVGKRPFVIFDEAHDYEELAFANFTKLLEALYLKGKDLCVMSATLPQDFADFLTVVDATQEPLAAEQRRFQEERQEMHHPEKKLTLVPAPNTTPKERERFLQVMEEQTRTRFKEQKRIIVRTEWIGNLLDLYARLQDLKPLVYHGRLTSRQRRVVIEELISRQKADQGFLVLATAAIEAGCDLDAHYIVSEICNPDSLIQLAGRLNRKCRMRDAELVLVGDGIQPLLRAIPADRIDEYYDDLEAMAGRFDPAVLNSYFQPPQGDWMGDILFEMLWEYVYEGDLTSKPLWDRGILLTRSWQPAVVLCTGIHAETHRPLNPVQIGINRLAVAVNKEAEELKKEKVSDWFSIEESGEWHAELKRAFFDSSRWEEARWSIYPFPERRINPYETNLLCVIGRAYRDRYFDPTLGYKKVPKILLQSFKNGYERIYQYRPKTTAKDGRFALDGRHVKNSGSLWLLER